MTEDKIREKYIKRVADEITSVHNYDKSPLEIASSILSIKGIHIEAENQELPANAYAGSPCPEEDGSEVAYEEAQQDMLKEGWVKCLKKGEE
jgi:hypothetical protein